MTHYRPFRPVRAAAARWLDPVRSIALAAAVLMAAALAQQSHEQSARARRVAMADWERGTHASVDWLGRRNLPVARVYESNGTRFADLVLVDSRLTMSTWWSRAFGPEPSRYYGPGGAGMQRAMTDHPVLLTRMQTDCVGARWRIDGQAISDSFDAPALASASYAVEPGGGWMRMTERNRMAVCGGSGKNS